eukprot:c16478_g1_i2 orf=540-1193(-)
MVPLKMMRQRYSLAADQVFTLSSVEVESPKQLSHVYAHGPSPLSSCTSTASASSIAPQSQPRISWRHRVEDCLWLASAFFILYYGDFHSDFFTLLANDARVHRTPLHMGLACLMLDCCMVMLYIALSLQAQEKSRLQAPGVIQAVTMLGSLAFILMSIALWPIWSFLTIPMLFTLFMAFTVVALHIIGPYMKVKLDLDCPDYLYVHSSCEHEKVGTS